MLGKLLTVSFFSENLNYRQRMKKLIYQLILFSFLSLPGFAQIKPKVLVLGAVTPNSWNEDVKAKLDATGAFAQVDIINGYLSSSPTLSQLQAYDAVLVFSDYGFSDPTALGNVLADYIDGGGGVVGAVFITASVPVGGRFNTDTYRVIVPAGQQSNSRSTLGTILLPAHPVMKNVTTFDGGPSSYRSTSNTLSPGSYRIADWTDGSFLITAKDNVGPAGVRRVDLGFYPVSVTVRNDFWNTATDGAVIMKNALEYVAGVPVISITPSSTVICPGGTVNLTAAVSPGYTTGPPTSLTWSAPPGVLITPSVNATAISAVFSSSLSGIQTLTLTARNTFTTSETISFNLNSSTGTVTLSASNSALSCTNPSLTLTATVTGGSNYTYSFSGPGLSATPSGLSTVTVNRAGIFTVTTQSLEGCSSSTTIAVSGGTLAAAAGPITVSGPAGCNAPARLTSPSTGQTFVFTGPGGYVFSNTYRNGGSYTAFAEGIKLGGTYTLTVYGSPGCPPATSTVVVQGPDSCPQQ